MGFIHAGQIVQSGKVVLVVVVGERLGVCLVSLGLRRAKRRHDREERRHQKNRERVYCCRAFQNDTPRLKIKSLSCFHSREAGFFADPAWKLLLRNSTPICTWRLTCTLTPVFNCKG